ncbi:MAG: hypothetical protein V1652_02690 [bacterium]
MKYAIVFYVADWDNLLRLYRHQNISPDREDYQRCVARERFLEIQACRNRHFSYFYCIDRQGGRYSFVGGRCRLGESYQLYTDTLEKVSSLDGYTALLRTIDPCVTQSVLSYIEAMGAQLVLSWSDLEKTRKWYKYIDSRFLQRQMRTFGLQEFVELVCAHRIRAAVQDLLYEDKIFIKSSYKTRVLPSKVCSIKGMVGYLGFAMERLPIDCDMIVSEILNFVTDDDGKQEYRVYVLNNTVVNISRYIDYRVDYTIPSAVHALACDFIAAHRDIFPHGYVLDIGIDVEK